MKTFIRVVIAYISYWTAVPVLFGDELLNIQCQLLSTVDTDIDSIIRQVSYAVPNQSVQTDELTWVTTLNSGALAFSHTTCGRIQRLSVPQKSVMPNGGHDWALGAIDSVSISPDGRWILLVEENGRFAVISTAIPPLATQYWLPALCFPEIALNRVGLEVTSWTWLMNDQLAISYADGRVITLDPRNGKSMTLLPSLWDWESKEPKTIPQNTVPENLKIFFPLASNVLHRTFSGKASEDRILSLSDHYFVVATRKSVEIRTIVNRRLCSELSADSYFTLPNGTILILKKSAHVSQCYGVSLKPDLEITTWNVQIDSDNSSSLRLVNSFACANGDFMTQFSDESHLYYGCLKRESPIAELEMLINANRSDSCVTSFFASDRNEFLQLTLLVTHEDVQLRLESLGRMTSE